jgi:hypothetical protein
VDFAIFNKSPRLFWLINYSIALPKHGICILYQRYPFVSPCTFIPHASIGVFPFNPACGHTYSGTFNGFRIAPFSVRKMSHDAPSFPLEACA